MNKKRKMSLRPETAVGRILREPGPFTIDEYEPGSGNLEELHRKRVLVIGAGGLGCEILKDLSLSGVKKIDVVDMDTIDVSNLNRQFLFRVADVGKSKATVAAEFVMKRVGGVTIHAHCQKIQDKSVDFYRQFDLIICGLDNVEARRWINGLVVGMYDVDDDSTLIPLIDGGSEGFRGQARVIFPRITACYECNLNYSSAKKTYPVCTIANTPRLPEHCVEYVKMIVWPREHGQREFDSDNPDDLQWVYERSLARAAEFHIGGVTRSLTLGVVKNIIPAIASTNAIIAASCVNESFKILTSCNPNLEYYMQYSGDSEPHTFTFEPERNQECPVCG